MHGIKRVKKPTDYGIQLRAKQKAKRIYGVQETQFKNYYTKAKKLSGLVGNNLLILLEKRLDNVIYQSGLSLSRSNARQLVSHGHVLVNGKVLNVASHHLKNSDVVSLDKTAIVKLGDTLRLSDKDFKSPQWLNLNKNKYTVSVAADPAIEDFNQGIDVNLIIEYYSR
jgi:small subunit ribosomal protein S4